jgi:hypothetical protein
MGTLSTCDEIGQRGRHPGDGQVGDQHYAEMHRVDAEHHEDRHEDRREDDQG